MKIVTRGHVFHHGNRVECRGAGHQGRSGALRGVSGAQGRRGGGVRVRGVGEAVCVECGGAGHQGRGGGVGCAWSARGAGQRLEAGAQDTKVAGGGGVRGVPRRGGSSVLGVLGAQDTKVAGLGVLGGGGGSLGRWGRKPRHENRDPRSRFPS
ncbi:hypothetical protein Syun_008324 [Stephania yunnanensis]|uniref:Uncharacterized protein n=1 Tax=Stephania yunnanensis TaxID=152371 RepID=A0AAP0KF22_9MAGN